jgi:hypothetical protein
MKKVRFFFGCVCLLCLLGCGSVLNQSEVGGRFKVVGRFSLVFQPTYEYSKPPEGLADPTFGDFVWINGDGELSSAGSTRCLIDCLELFGPFNQKILELSSLDDGVLIRKNQSEPARFLSQQELKEQYPQWVDLMELIRKTVRRMVNDQLNTEEKYQIQGHDTFLKVLQRNDAGKPKKVEIIWPAVVHQKMPEKIDDHSTVRLLLVLEW